MNQSTKGVAIKKLFRNKKRILWTVAVLVVLGIVGELTYSYLYPEYPDRGTAKQQTAHIERILARDSVEAEVRLCEQVGGRIKDPETVALFVNEVQLEALHIMAEEARDSKLSQDWHSFFFGGLVFEDRAVRPLSSRLIRELETADAETIEKVGMIIIAAMHNGGWRYRSNVGEGSVAGELLKRDLAAWEELLTTFLAKASATPGGQAAADNLIAHMAERHDGFEYDRFEGTPTHLSVNARLLDGPVGDAMIGLLGQWNNPDRGAAATRLMSAMMRQAPRTDGWWAAQHSARIGQVLQRELAASAGQGSPAQMGQILIEQLLARQKIVEGSPDPKLLAERLEKILLDGKIALTERTLRAVSMQGKRTPSPELLKVVDATAESGSTKLKLLAAVPGWAPELVAEAKRQGTEKAIHELHSLVFRLGRAGVQQELRDDIIRYLGGMVLGEGTKDKELRVEAADSLAYALSFENSSAHRELRQRVEAMVLPVVKNDRISIPDAPKRLRLEIVMNMDRIAPESSLYEICLAHYDRLPMDYKWGSAFAAARAEKAPKAAELFIRAFRDDSLEVDEPTEFPGYLSPPVHTLHWNLMSRLKLPMTDELVEAIANTSLVTEQEKQSFLRNKRAE